MSILFSLLICVRILLGLSLCAFCAYTLLTLWAARRWHRAKPVPDPAWMPAVTMLKPIRGVDAHAYENFASFCRLDYPPDRFQLIFGALDPEDPALALARRIQADFPHVDISVICSAPNAIRGYNLKVCNMLAMLPQAKHDLLALCDSDMRVEQDYLRRITAPFQNSIVKNANKTLIDVTSAETSTPSDTLITEKGGVGLVTCPYRGSVPQSPAAILEALGIGADFIPSALVSRALEGVSFAFGSTIVLPRKVLAELGGFEALLNELADDFRLGDGARRAGYTVVLSDYVVDDVLGPERFGPMWARRLRWARTVRSCRPAGYAGACITYGTVLALLFTLSMQGRALGWDVLFGILALRCFSAVTIGRLYTGDPNIGRFWPLLPISDLFSFALYIASYCGNGIVWRGERFRLLPGGQMIREDKRRE